MIHAVGVNADPLSHPTDLDYGWYIEAVSIETLVMVKLTSRIPDPYRWPLKSLLGFLFGLGAAVQVGAGGSPETTLVVVNARSPLSQRIANEYLQLRQVPDTHLLRLPDVPSFGALPIADFRGKILEPIQEYIRRHKLEEEIDLIAYSADFPYAVDFNSDLKANELPRNRYRGSNASLTGLTYFANRVKAGNLGYLGQNYYFRDFAGPPKQRTRAGGSGASLSEKEVQRLRKEAKSALKGKDYIAAQDRYRQIIDAYPTIPKPLYDLARAHAIAGEAKQALVTLATAVDKGLTHSLRTQRDSAFKALRTDPKFLELIERMENAYGPFQISHGFRRGYFWSNVDLEFWEPKDVLDQYYLSTMLAYTGVRGNSLPEVIGYLRRTAASDGSAPDGTVYLLENSNVRSETRQPLFPATVSQLARRGRKAEILRKGGDGQDGIIPQGRNDVIGAVAGTKKYSWEKSNSRLLPGAIAETLTSFGGHFDKAAQTKLTAFLRYGAAGSSGAVAEPYSFQEKFPVPLLHAYYADGCSLAEAFYQSIAAPYQLIIVGDPLARPFAKFAEIGLQEPEPNSPWSGVVAVEPTLKPARSTSIESVELWVDGQFLVSAPAGQTISWDTRSVDDGSHEIRLVAVETGVIKTRSTFLARIHVRNQDRNLEVVEVTSNVGESERIDISGRAAGAERVELRRGHNVLATSVPQNGIWKMSLPARELGVGDVMVFVRAHFRGAVAVRSDPLTLTVREPRLLSAATAERPSTAGLNAVVRYADGNTRHTSVPGLQGRLKGLAEKGRQLKAVVLTGFMQVKTPGFYQLAVRSDGRLKISIHQQVRLNEKLSKNGAETFLSLGLDAGWHPLEVEIAPGARVPFLRMVLAGADVPVLLDKKNLGFGVGDTEERTGRVESGSDVAGRPPQAAGR